MKPWPYFGTRKFLDLTPMNLLIAMLLRMVQ
jgi:hypothetical protein